MNRKLLYTLATVAALGLSSPAWAAEVSGQVVSIDEEAQTITLDNGMIFKVSDELNIDGLTPGATVKVTYESSDSGNVATGVERPKN